MTIEPQYIPYKKRMQKNLLKVAFLSLIYGLIFAFLNTKINFEVAIALICLYLITVAFTFRTDRIYLKSVSIDNESIKVTLVDKDIENTSLHIPISHAKILIKEKPFVMFNSYFGRNFKLEFQELFNGRFRIMIEQSECHEWDYIKFKEIYNEYCKQKDVPDSMSSIKRENF